MQKKGFWNILAYGVSILMYPLFVPTYLMAIFCALFSIAYIPLSYYYWALAVGGTAFFTCFVPLSTLLIMICLGRVKNLDVTNKDERFVPYLYTLVSMAFWCCFLHMIKIPPFLFWSGIASCVVLFLVMLITLKWKISVHLSCAGGACAMIIGMVMQYGFSPVLLFIPLICTWLLMLARIKLDAHTPLQAVCGFMLGLIIVLIPNIIFAYA